nr:Hsp70 family protein [Propionivibrio sp.]
MLSPTAIHSLGGEDFDQRLIDYIIDEFNGESGVETQAARSALQRHDAAEKPRSNCRRASRPKSNLPYITADASGPKHLAIKMVPRKI